MKTTTIDKQGRIVVPISFRKRLGMDVGSRVVITLESDAIMLRAEEGTCRRCGASVAGNMDFPLCPSCIEQIKRSHI